jgi:hypothetical protein
VIFTGTPGKTRRVDRDDAIEVTIGGSARGATP